MQSELNVVNRNLNLVIGKVIELPNISNNIENINHQLQLHADILTDNQKVNKIENTENSKKEQGVNMTQTHLDFVKIEKKKLTKQIANNLSLLQKVELKRDETTDLGEYMNNIEKFMLKSQNTLIDKFNVGAPTGPVDIDKAQRMETIN